MKPLMPALALSLALSALPVIAQTNRADLPVEVTFRSRSGDAVRGDTPAPYVDGLQKVRAVMAGFEEGNLVLDTNDSTKSPLRRVYLDFPPGSGMSDGLADVFMPMRSVDLYALEDDLRTLVPSATVQKRLNINWTSGRLNYHLRWNGETGAGFVTVAYTAPATTNAAVGDTCGAWTFTALATDLVNLYSSPTKGSYKETYVATISMPHEGYIVVK
jgi:hypothetical protein